MKENYDPEKHCCPNWSSDWCDCVKESIKAYKKERRDRNVNKTLELLRNNNIRYSESNTENVVEIDSGNGKAFVSLKREGFIIKVRFSGSGKWYRYKQDSFIKKFSNI